LAVTLIDHQGGRERAASDVRVKNYCFPPS